MFIYILIYKSGKSYYIYFLESLTFSFLFLTCFLTFVFLFSAFSSLTAFFLAFFSSTVSCLGLEQSLNLLVSSSSEQLSSVSLLFSEHSSLLSLSTLFLSSARISGVWTVPLRSDFKPTIVLYIKSVEVPDLAWFMSLSKSMTAVSRWGI